MLLETFQTDPGKVEAIKEFPNFQQSWFLNEN